MVININNDLPIWQYVPLNLASHSQLSSPSFPIEHVPPFLQIPTDPVEHLSGNKIYFICTQRSEKDATFCLSHLSYFL